MNALGLAALMGISAAGRPVTDLHAELLAIHETTRQAHLRSDVPLIETTSADRLIAADDGAAGPSASPLRFRRSRGQEWLARRAGFDPAASAFGG
jgi:hypothetical protein